MREYGTCMYWFVTGLFIIFPVIVTSLILPRRNHYILRCVACTALFIFVNLVTVLLPLPIIIDILIVHAVSALYFCICNNLNLKMVVYFKVWGIAFYYFALQLSCLATAWLSPEKFFENLVLTKIVVHLILGIPFFYLVKSVSQKDIYDLHWDNILLSLISSVALIAVNSLGFNMLNMRSVPTYLFQSASMTCLLLMLYMQIEIYSRQKKMTEAEFMKHLWDTQKDQYELKKEYIDLINEKYHDMKYQLAALEKMNGERATENIAELKRCVEKYDSMLHSGNSVIDTIINEKKEVFDKFGVHLLCMCDGTPLDFIKVSDLYILCGNALDNALESARQIKVESLRFVDVRIRKNHQFCRIRIENPYEGTIQFENGLPRSTKNDRNYHGFGVRSIRNIVEKYGGQMTIDIENMRYVLNILIPIPEENKE